MIIERIFQAIQFHQGDRSIITLINKSSNIFLAYDDEELLIYDKYNEKVEFKTIHLLEKFKFDPGFELQIPSIVKTIINDLV